VANPLLINAAELLRRPGSERRVSLTTTVDELGIADERFAVDDVVTVELRLESLTDGIVVDGTISVPWHGTCRRCLAAAAGMLECEVNELYQHTITDPDAFELTGDQLDLRPMVREVILLDAPRMPLCRPDCAGLCPVCGADRNVDPCDCRQVVTDARWDALVELGAQLAHDDPSNPAAQ
jgi:uncharacterized protein